MLRAGDLTMTSAVRDAPPTDPPAWALDAGAVAESLAVDPDVGLAPAEAARRLEASGPNDLDRERRRSALVLLAAQFANTMTVVLAGAAVVTVLIGDGRDAIVVSAIVALNAAVGFVQERRAEQAVAALRRMTAERATVRRGGQVADVAAGELVPGDVVVLATGDVVPADLRLVEVAALRIDEATLTGESEPVAKHTLPVAAEASVAERLNVAYKGTAVTYGRAVGIAVATGMATELGRIAGLLQAHPAGTTPLQRRLAHLGRWMAAGAAAVCVVVFVVGVASGEPADQMFLTAVSLAVAAIPEGLPAVVTVSLALGARRMAERHAIVRRLPAVATLGSVTVICTDNTGTLTRNHRHVERVWTPLGGERSVTGDGYAPAGEVSGGAPDADLRRLAEVAVACNDAVLHGPHGESSWSITGDPTEGALLALGGKVGIDQAALAAEAPRAGEVAFDALRRRMTTAHTRGGGVWIACKGALDSVAACLDGDGAGVDAADAVAGRWAADGYRILAFAEGERAEVPDRFDDLERGLRLAGLVAIADPPRSAASGSIAACRRAGIHPVVITGDDARTATAIASRLGILDGNGAVVAAADTDGWDDTTFAERAPEVAVYARATPEHKLRIVDAWKASGAVVAMTGDGVNDAPALRRADIGVAMGVTGTDVSKEAADLVLTDDDFTTIVHAVAEGRRIYDNLRRFVRYLLTTNSGEVWFMLLAPLLGMPVPLLPVQLLWVNLVTDGLPAVALGLEPAEPDVMDRPPRPPGESVFARGLWQHALWVGLLMAGVGLATQFTAREMGWHWRTMVFTTVAFVQLGHALAIRSEHASLRSLGLRTNPALLAAVGVTVALQLAIVYAEPLHAWFHTAALGVTELAITVAASTVVLLAVELEKWLGRRRATGNPPSVPPPTPGG
jgi:Ca2+-transporting ATPase